MKHRPLSSASFLFRVALVLPAGAFFCLPAFSQTAPQGQQSVNVYQYAVENPVDNAQMRQPPTLGASVPKSVRLVSLDEKSAYAYFYYDGFPVIVDVTTRSVVRIGK